MPKPQRGLISNKCSSKVDYILVAWVTDGKIKLMAEATNAFDFIEPVNTPQLTCLSPSPTLRRYIRSERSIILVNFCLSILASNLLILVGQSQTLSKVRHQDISAFAFQSAPAVRQFWLLSRLQPELSKAGPIIVKSNFGLFIVQA